MIIRQKSAFKPGYTPITACDDPEQKTGMDFGTLILEKDGMEVSAENKERAYLLIKGIVRLEWEGKSAEISRTSFLDEAPWCLHLPAGTAVKITGLAASSEINVTKTINDQTFEAKLYTQDECVSEVRGEGTMQETCTRIVRTVFDKRNAPWSNLVLGEVINFPGKWSSFPPHNHTQTEIYYYKFMPENGYGFAQLGEDDVCKVQNNDTTIMADGIIHPQVVAPGYAMYYIWVIRHLEGDPYLKPNFLPEHFWVMDKNAVIWPDKA